MAMGIIAVTTLAATPWQMGVLEAAESAAVLLLGLAAGVWADWYERWRILLVANLARSVLVLAIPVLFWLDLLSMAVLYVVVFLVHPGTAAEGPAVGRPSRRGRRRSRLRGIPPGAGGQGTACPAATTPTSGRWRSPPRTSTSSTPCSSR